MTRKEAVYLIQRLMLMLHPEGEPISDLYEALSLAIYDMGIVDEMKKQRDAMIDFIRNYEDTDLVKAKYIRQVMGEYGK